jgi:uncharacterized protein YjbJ (UPF0337 family)
MEMSMNKSNVSGKFDEMKGKVKQSVGEATHNDRMANSGAADQVKGSAKQAWGDTRDAATSASRQSADDAEFEAHKGRNKVVNMAKDTKDAISNRADDYKRKRSA